MMPAGAPNEPERSPPKTPSPSAGATIAAESDCRQPVSLRRRSFGLIQRASWHCWLALKMTWAGAPALGGECPHGRMPPATGWGRRLWAESARIVGAQAPRGGGVWQGRICPCGRRALAWTNAGCHGRMALRTDEYRPPWTGALTRAGACPAWHRAPGWAKSVHHGRGRALWTRGARTDQEYAPRGGWRLAGRRVSTMGEGACYRRGVPAWEYAA